MRVFAAVVPPEPAVASLEAFLEPRLEAGRADSLRWSTPEQWHVTLAFAADVAEHRLEEIAERLAAAARRRRPFTVRVAGGGAFPDPGRARVLWAGLDLSSGEPVPQGPVGAPVGRPADPAGPGAASAGVELDRLATGVRTALATSGAAVDGARFRPHLTLARRHRPGDVGRWVRLLEGWSGPAFTVEEVALVASHLGEGPRGGPRHERLLDVALGDGAR